jgi:hypothetical protein
MLFGNPQVLATNARALGSKKINRRPQMADELAFPANRIWWWDPPPPWVMRDLGEEVQREIFQIAIHTQVAVLQAQIAGLEKIGAAIARGKLGGAPSAKAGR